MRSPTVRLTLCAAAWLAIGASVFFLTRSDSHIAQLRAAVRTFDLRARDAADALADLRVAQEAYVAEGQNVALWMPKVAATSEALGPAIASLRQSATSAGARAALEKAANNVAEFGAIDKRARDYIKSGQQLMAGDVIFSEGGETALRAARQVESARLGEHQALEAEEAVLRKQRALVLGAAGSLAALIVLVLVLVPVEGGSAMGVGADAATTDSALEAPDPTELLPDLSLRPTPESPPPTPGRPSSPALRAAAELCTDFGRLRDLADLQALLGRAAEVMDASGLVVWFGSAAGADLRPVLAHGYPPHTFARMPNVPRACNNAAAAAYRTGRLQIVLSRPSSSGALVAPIHSSDGCVGALSAEIRGGGETSESVQALASIFAAQLAPILATAPAAEAAGDKRAVASS